MTAETHSIQFDDPAHSYIQVDRLKRNRSVRHGFFTRLGGVSCEPYCSLNTGFGSADDRDRVYQNRCYCAGVLGFSSARLITPYQVHGNSVLTLRSDEDVIRESLRSRSGKKPAPGSDAIVTDLPETLIGVLSADCGPLLLVDSTNRVIGAAHAGWKGVVSRVLESTVEIMTQIGASPEHIDVALGPMICGHHFEVDANLRKRFVSEDPSHHFAFQPSSRTGHFLCDLRAILKKQADELGVNSFHTVDACSYGDPDRFFSHRRGFHDGRAEYGRMISLIGIHE